MTTCYRCDKISKASICANCAGFIKEHGDVCYLGEIRAGDSFAGTLGIVWGSEGDLVELYIGNAPEEKRVRRQPVKELRMRAGKRTPNKEGQLLFERVTASSLLPDPSRC